MQAASGVRATNARAGHQQQEFLGGKQSMITR
jgi:hypothetical protein